MTTRLCRWGILGSANIAKKNWLAIRNSGNAIVTAVASRSTQRAEAFIDECQRGVAFDPKPKAYGSYEELLADESIDAVYVPVPSSLRKEWVIAAAQAGKHVLGEKPAANNADEVRAMVEACKANGVQYMDGVMFMHSRRLNKLRETLDDGVSVGQLKRIATAFSFYGDEEWLNSDIRSHSGLEPLGCLGDLGWYTIRMTLWMMNYQLPQRVRATMLDEAKRGDSPDTVPMEFSAELFFADGVSATFYNSFRTQHQQWIHISGTKGFVHIPDFVLPFFGAESSFSVTNSDFVQDVCEFNMERHSRSVSVAEYSNSHPHSQETNMIRRFSNHVLDAKPDHVWGEITLKTQQVLDACLQSARKDGAMVELA